MPKIERTTSSVTATRTTAVAKPAAPAPSAPATPPSAATYTGKAAPTKELIPNGKPVATSASPNALWGEQPKPVSVDRDAFTKLTPAQQAEAVKAAQSELDALGVQIQHRVDQLDRRWKNSRLVTRTEALREYQEQGGRLSPHCRRDLDRLLQRSEAAQVRINELRAKIDKLPKTPEAKKEQAALRAELAKELRRARDEQSKVVKEATAVVDAEGLKVDRLAVTEQIIDPSAPKPGSGESLLEKVARFFHLDEFINWVSRNFVNLAWQAVSEVNEKARETKAKDDAADRDHRLDDRLKTERLKEELKYLRVPEQPQASAV
jgi:uncharacterized protein YnzC (UPF0291/DUF896 family)